MVLTHFRCAAKNSSGEPCGAPPVHDGGFCFWHDPDSAADASEAQHLGGLRRRRDQVVRSAHDIESLDSVSAIRHVVEIVLTDGLQLPNTPARLRVLLAAAVAATHLLEVRELEQSVEALEDALGSRKKESTPRGQP